MHQMSPVAGIDHGSMIGRLFSLTGRTALVTGASSGIGQRMAYALAGAGADVVLLARRGQRLNEAVSNIVRSYGVRAAALEVDLLAPCDFEDLAARAAGYFGAPDILVNSAGINLREPWNVISEKSWGDTLRLNLSVPFFLARSLVPGMLEKGQGNIINIGSLQTYRAFPNGIPYGASKGGVAQLTRAMAEAWSKDGTIIVNAIAPGYFFTEHTAVVFEKDPAMIAHHKKMTAIGRNGELEDLDGATIFLASRASAYITGQVLAVDGGYTAK